MKAKRIRRQFKRQMQAAFHDNLRAIWTRLCGLSFRERRRLAWMLIRGDADLDRAARKGKR